MISFRARGRPSPFGPIRDVLRQGSGLRTRVGKDVGPGAQDDGRRRVLPHNSHTGYIKLRPRPSRFSNFLSLFGRRKVRITLDASAPHDGSSLNARIECPPTKLASVRQARAGLAELTADGDEVWMFTADLVDA